jgi:hypothetical protein
MRPANPAECHLQSAERANAFHDSLPPSPTGALFVAHIKLHRHEHHRVALSGDRHWKSRSDDRFQPDLVKERAEVFE